MTFSPIISAAGADPDSAATDPAGTAVDPAAAMPHPAVAPDAGSGPGQPATAASYTGSAAGQAGSPTGQADSAAGYADPYPTGRASAAAEQGGYSATGQGGYSATEQGAYPAGQGSYPDSSAEAAGSATDSVQQDEAGAAWPHQTFLELGALATAAPCARLHTTLVLWEWELGTLVNAAGLVVSELVSNAVAASAALTGSRFAGYWAPGTPPVRVWLSADDHRVVIQVWDGSDRPPVPQPVAPEADSGRGLLLVGALSEEWGCYTPEKSSGKVVWAVVTA
jgi:hypothetical protein